VRYDPTPPDLRARPELALSFSGQLRQLGSALELWWYQSVLGFDRSDQIHAAKRAWLAWQSVKGAGRGAAGGPAVARLRGGVPGSGRAAGSRSAPACCCTGSCAARVPGLPPDYARCACSPAAAW
jgi:hypothetical protein